MSKFRTISNNIFTHPTWLQRYHEALGGVIAREAEKRASRSLPADDRPEVNLFIFPGKGDSNPVPNVYTHADNDAQWLIGDNQINPRIRGATLTMRFAHVTMESHENLKNVIAGLTGSLPKTNDDPPETEAVRGGFAVPLRIHKTYEINLDDPELITRIKPVVEAMPESDYKTFLLEGLNKRLSRKERSGPSH